MQILAAEQIRAWDEFTIRHEPISSIDLMERAARTCFDWLMEQGFRGKRFTICCGKGNNGGDGLAIARMLSQTGHAVTVYILEFGHKGTEDFQVNLAALHNTTATIRFVSSSTSIPPIGTNEVIVDALLGSGLNRPLEGLTAQLAQHMNDSGNPIIAIDIPSGMYVDSSSAGLVRIHATHTLSFQCYKPAFLVPENAMDTGAVHILDIGLHVDYLNNLSTVYTWVDVSLVRTILQPREAFAHKGNFGHAALVAGSKGMMGAAALSAKACMRSGVGKLTCHIPAVGLNILQSIVPEAMCIVEDGDDHLQSISNLEKYDAIAVGPGIGRHDVHLDWMRQLFQWRKPLVIDADALNTMAEYAELLQQIPAQSILTPHVGEFGRLFGKAANDFDRIKMALQQAAALQCVIVLKGAHTFIATPGGKGYFNSTGNPGMATAGSGDVLTGILTALMAQAYPSEQAAIAGVFLHGLAGDLAAGDTSQASLIASDIIEYLRYAFQQTNS